MDHEIPRLMSLITREMIDHSLRTLDSVPGAKVLPNERRSPSKASRPAKARMGFPQIPRRMFLITRRTEGRNLLTVASVPEAKLLPNIQMGMALPQDLKLDLEKRASDIAQMLFPITRAATGRHSTTVGSVTEAKPLLSGGTVRVPR